MVKVIRYLRSCTILNKGLPKEQKSERKGVRKVELDGYGNHRGCVAKTLEEQKNSVLEVQIMQSLQKFG